MVLTAAQTTAFFENDDQMAIPHATVIQLRNEGISTVGDLIDFDKDTLQRIAENLRRPGGRIANPDRNAEPGETIATPPYVFGAKSQKRLLAACDIVRYYSTTGRALNAANMRWNVVKNFADQWKALKDRREDETPEVPKITKALPVIKWTEAFTDYLHRAIGVRHIPLAYVVRENAEVAAAAPTLIANMPHSTEHGSIEIELISRAAHTHPLFRDDNSTVYYKLEEATRTTAYAASIKPFQRSKNGRGAWLALKSQYAGDDKWEAEIKKQSHLLHTRVWKGQNNFTLERFIAQHRNAFVSMQACSEHIAYQLPNEHTRVGYLLDAIMCSDAGLQAAMASIRTDTSKDGMRSNFESSASHLLPYDPVAKKLLTGNKRASAEISETVGAEISSVGTKQSIGRTGVHLRYHTPEEYNKLQPQQKDELREWRKNNPDKKKDKANKQKNKKAKANEKAIAAAVEKKVDERLKGINVTADDAKAKAYIMSLFSDGNSKEKTNSGKNALNAIISRAKNPSA